MPNRFDLTGLPTSFTQVIARGLRAQLEDADAVSDPIDTLQVCIQVWDSLSDLQEWAKATQKNVQSAPVLGADNLMEDKTFKQPRGDFSVYDTESLIQPDQSTPRKRAIVAFENSIRGLDIEWGAFFDAEGNILFKGSGDFGKVTFSFNRAELLLLVGKTFTHNHPHGGNFSFEDVESSCDLRLGEVRVVTSLFRFSMVFDGKWVSTSDLLAAIELSLPKANDAVKMMIASDELSVYHANDEVAHQLWLFVAQLLGFKYKREHS